VPVIQKEIIKKCKVAKKPVIVATQMLDSMSEELLPTRAEVSDVANAILDGADYLLLSSETAVGKHPDKVVEMMNKIIKNTESYQKKLKELLCA
jgi:pyruvate kinase